MRKFYIKKYGDENLGSILGYCNQKPQIFKNETLRENLLVWSGRNVSDDEINSILEELNLSKFIDKLDDKIKYVSGGEAVRIGLARVLLKNPKIMILDEPTASLDAESRQEVINIIEKIREANPEKTVISVSHDEEFINKADRIYEL